MGLDISLYNGAKDYESEHPDDFPGADASEADKEAWRQELSRRHREQEERNKSRLHPDHLCNRRYLRSSYNDGGFNRVVGKLLGITLDDIFLPEAVPERVTAGGDDDEDDYSPPSWPKEHLSRARERAVECRDKMRAVALPLATFDVGPNMFSLPPRITEEEALSIAAKQMERVTEKDNEAFGYNYSNKDGQFFLKGLEIVAAIPGVDLFGKQTVHIVHKMTGWDWYLQMADIIVEFIDEALAMDDPCISWSG